ncbi:MAG: Lacal_2735 family protein [Planctomycetota bacterium]
MFGLFQDPKAKLEKRYAKLLEESHRLSTIDREASDRKAAEADEVLRQIEAVENGQTAG